MAKLTPTLKGKIQANAMLDGIKWQKAFIVSLVINVILFVVLYVR
jgi:hypothetical protein